MPSLGDLGPVLLPLRVSCPILFCKEYLSLKKILMNPHTQQSSGGSRLLSNKSSFQESVTLFDCLCVEFCRYLSSIYQSLAVLIFCPSVGLLSPPMHCRLDIISCQILATLQPLISASPPISSHFQLQATLFRLLLCQKDKA